MPFPLSRAKKIVERYRDFPDRLRSSQEDIIKTLYGEEIRGRSVYTMLGHQVFCFSRRLYRDAREMVEKAQTPAKISDLERKVEKKPEQGNLFNPAKGHWQY